VEIAGAVAIVTGASSGIGEATANAMARAGATVVAVARRAEQLEQVAARCREHTSGSFAHAADIASRDAAESVVRGTERELGRVDIIVNNAGISLRRHAAEASVEEIDNVMQVNYFGAVYLTMAALPGMLARRRGSIINITSVAGYVPTPHESAYGASKAALSFWSHGLAVDLHGTGVHVGVVSPGPVDTEIWAKDIEDAAYNGKLYPPERIADGILKSIRDDRVHATVPRQYGAVGALYPIFGKPMRSGLRRYEEKAGARRQRNAGDTGGGAGGGDDS